MKINPKDFYESMERFAQWRKGNTDLELSNCNWQIFSGGRCIEHWSEHLGETYIVQYYPKGMGFEIYKCME